MNRPLPEMWTMVSDFLLRGTTNQRCDELGKGVDRDPPLDMDKNSKEAVRRHTSDRTYRVATNTASLEHMIQLAEQRNIKVLIVTPPVWASYSEGSDFEQLNELTGTMEHLVANHGNVMYRNYFEDPDFVRSDFMDGDHLGSSGAVKLTGKLLADVTCDPR
ncbi:MAG: hypothetical protein IPG92_12025 [Flavobacteriales bacterium]|nr:hypothetical protein [Flavobacteriales bacterium]